MASGRPEGGGAFFAAQSTDLRRDPPLQRCWVSMSNRTMRRPPAILLMSSRTPHDGSVGIVLSLPAGCFLPLGPPRPPGKRFSAVRPAPLSL